MKDIIYVENHYFVTVKNESLKFKNVIEKNERFYLLDDIEALVFDSPRSYYSQKLIIKCIEYNILILFCDLKHTPIAEIISNFGMINRLQRIQDQLQVLSKTKDRVWKKIVANKITNQAKCIENNVNNMSIVKILCNYSRNVGPGDRTNRESVAARLYFQNLYGKKFKRGRYDDKINSALNYGYSILRSFIKKELAIHGFEMSLGIKHRSTENPYNLADDIIECYRPFVDSMVYDLIFNQHITSFGVTEKKKMLEVLYENCLIDKKIVKLVDSIKITVQSLIRCYEQNTPTHLLLPKLIEVGN